MKKTYPCKRGMAGSVLVFFRDCHKPPIVTETYVFYAPGPYGKSARSYVKYSILDDCKTFFGSRAGRKKAVVQTLR